jgi:structural maintenance of chromosome 1
MHELKEGQGQLDQAVKVKRDELARARKRTEDARKELTKHHQKARVVLNFRCGIFRDCNERQVEIPLQRRDDAALERVLSREQDIDDLPYHDLEAACAAVQVDFSRLPEDQKAVAETTDISDTKPVESHYEARIAEVTIALEGLNPNMRAPEECAIEAEKLKEMQRKAEESSLESQRLARAFDAVKAERISKFTKCFKHVEEKVHPYYRDLTSYDGNQGGSAYLDLDDTEEPYNGGIMFTACPPGKRFFPMELLSGGEKSMASMALLFAMHSFQPPPFMILDEVDAPFDRKNTTSLVRYLKTLDFQCLVISLKDTFFAHSDSIVGIYKDKEVQTSGCLSLPLRRLGEESEAPETEVPLAEVLADID